jgi:hypothetical protein
MIEAHFGTLLSPFGSGFAISGSGTSLVNEPDF